MRRILFCFCLAAIAIPLAAQVSAASSAAGLVVQPNFLFFRQTGSATLAPQQVKLSAVGSVALGSFTATASTATGGSWLSVSPTSGSGAATLTVSVNSSGLAAGEYAGTITIAATGFSASATIGVLLEVEGNSLATIIVRPSHLEFDAVAGGSAPPAQSVMIISPAAAAASWTATATVTTPPGGTWLKLGATSGMANDALKVMADPTGLAAGSYSGTVAVTSGGSVGTVSVTFNVAATKPPALDLDPPVMFFDPDDNCAPPKACPSTGTVQQRTLNITNGGSGTISWTATIAYDSTAATSWLSLSATSGTTPSAVTVTANSAGLAKGVYSAKINVSGASQTAVTHVYMEVDGASQPVVHVHPKVMEFHFGQGVVTPASRDIHITSQATGLSFTAAASTASGGNWLSVSPTSGSITTSSFTTASVSASVAGTLAPGWYLGKIEIQTPGASQVTHDVVVALKVHGANESIELEVEPGGIGFSAVAGQSSPGPQSVLLEVEGGATLAWTAAVSTNSGGTWLSATPTSGNTTTAITVSVNTKGLAAGVYDGSVVFTPAATATGTNTVTLRVHLVVVATGGQATSSGGAITSGVAGAAATPTLTGFFSAPAIGFISQVNMGLNVTFNLMDQTGAAVTGATVTVSSSNTEPSLVLTDNGDGTYSGVFEALVAGPLVLTANAQTSTAVSNAVSVSGDIESDTVTSALVYQGGTVSAASYAPSPTPLTAGGLVSIFGVNLSTGTGIASSLPLPTSLAGVSVTIGGFPAAMVSTSTSPQQINLEVPWEVQGAAQADVVVSSNGVITPPQTVMLAPASPALFTVSQNGTGPGAFLHGADYSAVSATAPAKAGEVVLLYATGLGAVQTPLADGNASAGTDATVSPVTVMIGGQAATVQYAGMAPGFAGLYQVNVVIPSGVPSGDALVVVSVGGIATGAQATITMQ